jgi:tetratricopeptide (TPR) repeat protein
MREAYAAEMSAQDRRAALAEADAMMERALQSGMARLIAAAAYRALALSPLCADAYAALADDAQTPEVALDFYKRAVHAGELGLGPEMFERSAGQFGTVPETRPYLRALRGLADVLLEVGREDEAIGHLETIMRLNPGDDMGVRYPLLAYYLDQFDLQPARDLVAAFATEDTTMWLYSRVLLAYRDELQAASSTQALIDAALAANPHVPGILARQAPDVFADEDEEVPPGSVAEASEYVELNEEAWTSTPGAVAWLLSKAG